MIKPYYTDNYGTLYCGDSSEILKQFPDEQFDLCLTDYPYGLSYGYDIFDDTQESLVKLINNTFPEIRRISKRVLLTCGHTNIWHYPPSDWILAWIISAGANRNKWGFTTWQPILAYGKDPYLANRMGARHDTIYSNAKSEKLNHPCPKPIEIWEKILLRGSVKESDVVIDPFFGTGTTGIICEKNNRKWTGIELSENYCKIAVERILNERTNRKRFT